MDPLTLMLADRVVQWLVIPLLLGFVYLYKQNNQHDKEILRILTILEERNRRRDEDMLNTEKTHEKLYGAIEKLTSRIENLLDHNAKGGR